MATFPGTTRMLSRKFAVLSASALSRDTKLDWTLLREHEQLRPGRLWNNFLLGDSGHFSRLVERHGRWRRRRTTIAHCLIALKIGSSGWFQRGLDFVQSNNLECRKCRNDTFSTITSTRPFGFQNALRSHRIHGKSTLSRPGEHRTPQPYL